MSDYSSKFFDKFREASLSASCRIVPMVLEILSPIKTINTVLDVGCGLGGWLHTFKEHGIADIKGVDGAYVEKGNLYIDPAVFQEVDLEQPLELKRKFDLVCSVEVAEHISGKNSGQFVDSLCRHGDIILFSAAIPCQGGMNHVNEQFPSYWAALFAERGYICCDCIRKRIWNDPKVPIAHKQNIMLYIRNHLISSNNNPDFYASYKRIDIVHPDMYLTLINRIIKFAQDNQNQ